MTMMTPIEGITAPAIPARTDVAAAYAGTFPATRATARERATADDDDHLANRPLDPDDLQEDFARTAATEGPAFTTARRADGWTPDRQRGFLDYLAQGCTVSDAATLVGMSATSAYAFRKRAAGAAFAVGWSAAQLLQRNRLADELMGRALKGNVDYAVNPKGERVERHRHDNRLALALLTRLDRIAAADVPDRTGDARAARLAAQDWDRYLDIIGGDASPAQAGLFLSLRTTEGESAAIAPIVALARADLYRRTGAGHAGEVHVHDLDPAHRHDWSAADWARAEAGGLVSLAAPAKEDAHSSQLSQLPRNEDYGVWWSDYAEDWRTAFPPPAGFDGVEDGAYGNGGYCRSLSDDELDAVETWNARELEAKRVPQEAERVRFFAELLAGDVGADACPSEPCSGDGRSVGEREPDKATAPACAGAREDGVSSIAPDDLTEDGPLPVGAELVEDHPLPVRAELVEAPYFVPQAVKSEEEGRPFDELRANGGYRAGEVSLTSPAAGVNPASSDGAIAPPAGAGAEVRVRSFATA
ncbi:hypothetical protein ASE86_02070 [Sphingomonas sp. Leaf33]|uniref:hypothetical protein n=1 Tax=Sphingomonas sp. Leaf33 TaxID=1736215 RepID=UPI0006F5EE8A|nr:hypothetical protein [Sphingomonas sp. Leaf33]KQN25074.1 hypothetical protein ASE86_02070 [Sphingomonas sp. Leaf33]